MMLVKKGNCFLFLDLVKTFNTVSHLMLVSKLKFYDIEFSMLNFIQSYL